MALSELDMMNLWAKQLTGYASQWERLFGFGYAIEAEVRKQDDAMILQLVEALESARVWKCKEIHHMMREAQYTPAIQAGRARLGEKT